MQAIPLIIGVDVSKATLACSLDGRGGQETILNREVEISHWLSGMPPGSVLAVESTGRYHLLLAELALRAGLRVYVLNARDVFFYAKALGMRGKTDRTDAQVIARYVAEHQPQLHLWSPGTALHQSVQDLVRRRAGITRHRSALRQLLEDMKTLAPQLQKIELEFKQMLLEIDRQLQEELQQDCEMRRVSALLQTITGIGPLGAAMLTSLLGRIHFANADALVAYSGLDPRPNDSGQKHGRRKLSKRGPPELRRQMYLAGFSAAHSKALKPVYRSLRDKGFAATEAFVILGRKLLRVVWAVWRSGKPFEPARLVGASP